MPKESLYIVWMHAFGVTKRRNAGSVQKFLYDTEFVLRQIYTLKEQSKRRLYAIFTAQLRFEVAKLKLELKRLTSKVTLLDKLAYNRAKFAFLARRFFRVKFGI